MKNHKKRSLEKFLRTEKKLLGDGSVDLTGTIWRLLYSNKQWLNLITNQKIVMKTLLKISVLLIAFIALNSQESNAQVKAGVGAAFASEIEQVGIQGDLHYRFANIPAIQVGGSLIYYFPKDDRDFIEANLNGAYIFYDEYMFKSYLYTGLHLAQASIDGSVKNREIGLNVGLGAEYDFGPLLAFGDLKYVFSETDQPVFSIGLRLPFGGN